MQNIRLALSYFATDPPSPSKIVAIVGKEEVGEISLDEFKKMYLEIQEMWVRYYQT